MKETVSTAAGVAAGVISWLVGGLDTPIVALVIAAGGLKGDRWEPKTTADWYVCRNTKMPAVLMEYGFMDSPDDVPVILTEEHAKLCGYATIDAIAKKAGLKLRQSPESEPMGGVRYKGIADAPEYARHAIAELMACGALNGTGREKGIDLDLDALRVLTIVMRYAKFLHGLEPEQEEIVE